MLTQAQARIAFVSWLQNAHPALAAAAIEAAENSSISGNATNGLGQYEMGPPAPEISGGSFWEKLTTGAIALGGTYLTLKAQRDAMKINLARAEQGLPPIDPALAAPTIRTVVDIDPNLARNLASNIGSGLNRTLLFAGAAILAFFLFTKK